MNTRSLSTSVLAALCALCASGAWSESNTTTGAPGFFKPTPDGDPALKITRPASTPNRTQSTPLATAPADSVALAQTDPLEKQQVVREIEKDLDRARQEHERASEKSQQAATTIPGAFTEIGTYP
jgi:hypothetical protein